MMRDVRVTGASNPKSNATFVDVWEDDIGHVVIVVVLVVTEVTVVPTVVVVFMVVVATVEVNVCVVVRVDGGGV